MSFRLDLDRRPMPLAARPMLQPEEKPVLQCECGKAIYDGDSYYCVCGEVFCEECIDDCKKIAEADE